MDIASGIWRAERLMNDMWAGGFELGWILQGPTFGAPTDARYVFK